MTLVFCFAGQTIFAQESSDTNTETASKVDLKKDDLIKKYSWTKSFFDNTTSPVIAVKEMLSVAGTDYVLIETKDSKTMYDSDGKRYCADSAELNCIEFYKLKPGILTWNQS